MRPRIPGPNVLGHHRQALIDNIYVTSHFPLQGFFREAVQYANYCIYTVLNFLIRWVIDEGESLISKVNIMLTLFLRMLITLVSCTVNYCTHEGVRKLFISVWVILYELLFFIFQKTRLSNLFLYCSQTPSQWSETSEASSFSRVRVHIN